MWRPGKRRPEASLGVATDGYYLPYAATSATPDRLKTVLATGRRGPRDALQATLAAGRGFTQRYGDTVTIQVDLDLTKAAAAASGAPAGAPVWVVSYTAGAQRQDWQVNAQMGALGR